MSAIIFGVTPKPPAKCLTCKRPRWQWDATVSAWVCLACYKGNPLVVEYGSGPDGKQCQECAHLYQKRYSGVYYKCTLRGNTNGPGTDHRVHWPACARFELAKEAT